MKTSFQRVNVIMFFFALFNINFISSLELSSLMAKTKVDINLDAFKNTCYYDLKTNFIIENFIVKVKEESTNFLTEYANYDENDITFELVWTFFKQGNYGQIACELAGSEDYVRSYYNHFKGSNGKMTLRNFYQFVALYILEGELLVEEVHPTLSLLFPNEHNIQKSHGCKITLAFWELTDFLLEKIYIQFNWSSDRIIKRQELFTILTVTQTGKCYLMSNDKCDFFEEWLAKNLGFMNMSSGRREGLTVFETKLAYSTLLFSDVSKSACEQTTFNDEILKQKIDTLNIN